MLRTMNISRSLIIERNDETKKTETKNIKPIQISSNSIPVSRINRLPENSIQIDDIKQYDTPIESNIETALIPEITTEPVIDNIINKAYSIDSSGNNIIDPFSIKRHKMFIIERTTIIGSDSSCNGIEIILYNKTRSEQIVRDYKEIICKIKAKSAVRLLYTSIENKWIVI